MNLKELKARLQADPRCTLALALPDGRPVPPHFHVTEIGHVAKNFVDCGGRFHAAASCVLQTYLGSPRDDGHRLSAGKLAKILELAQPILPDGELPVEVEYEDCRISQFPVTGAAVAGGTLTLQLGRKHTDCLAKEKCGIDDGCAFRPGEGGGGGAAPAGRRACC